MRIIAEFTPLQTTVYSIVAFVTIATALIVSLIVHQ
jgi:hypothetical protein